MSDDGREQNGPEVHVPPEQRDEMLALINANRRSVGLLPQLYPGHDPYAACESRDMADKAPESGTSGVGPQVGDVIGGRWTITSGPISVQGPNCGRPDCPTPDHPTHYHCGRCDSPDVTSMLGHERNCPAELDDGDAR